MRASLSYMMLEKLGQVVDPEYKGPRASFAQVHVLKAILSIGEMQSIGRGKLGAILYLGQGEVRTLIKRLKDTGLLEVKPNGCALTESGRKEYEFIKRIVPWAHAVESTSLDLGKFSFAVLVRGRAKKVRKGIEQRDAAIKAGARGALTVVYSSGKFRVPSEGTDCEGEKPSEPWTTIRKALPKEADVIIVSGGEDALSAEYGALSAALTIIQ